MSWGERSCKWYFDQQKTCKPTMINCNVNCEKYEWDGLTKQDSVKSEIDFYFPFPPKLRKGK